jgi:hypothetical protein
MAVVEAATGSKVTISAEYSVAGRVAQFGRGVMEDVARRLLGQMADCIKSRLESADAGTTRLQAPSSEAGTAPLQPPPTAREEEPARPVNALGLLFSVLWARIRGLFRRRGAPA